MAGKPTRYEGKSLRVVSMYFIIFETIQIYGVVVRQIERSPAMGPRCRLGRRLRCGDDVEP